MGIDELLTRDGLLPHVRLLVLATASVWRGDWEQFKACAHRSRIRGQPRTEFEEMLLQSVLFAGFPRVVTAFESLANVWPPPSPPSGGALPSEQQAAAGRELFAAIYAHNDATVQAMLRGFHTDFHSFVLDVAYGRVLSRPGLEAGVRELLAIGALAAQDQVRQFVAHARGALNLGRDRAELREVLVTVLGDSREVDAWLQRVR
jgi:alkylhydroperoxidase/carboxymuconolactone decarboxylase family protein YurZ